MNDILNKQEDFLLRKEQTTFEKAHKMYQEFKEPEDMLNYLSEDLKTYEAFKIVLDDFPMNRQKILNMLSNQKLFSALMLKTK